MRRITRRRSLVIGSIFLLYIKIVIWDVDLKIAYMNP